MNNILTKDNCLFYGLPGMVILIISTLATVNISVHFNENTLVTSVAFVGCNVSGWLAYLLLQYLLGDLLQVSDIVRGRNKAQLQMVAQSADGKLTAVAIPERTIEETKCREQQIPEGIVSTDTLSTQIPQLSDEAVSNSPISQIGTNETDEVISNDPIHTIDNRESKEVISNHPLASPAYLTQKQYDKAQLKFDNKIAAEKAEHEHVIIEYVNRIMVPFVEQDNLAKLCIEILKWCEDSKYKPEAIPLKYFPEFSCRLKTTDLKHFIWNIGERMHNRAAYTGACRAAFVKALFPDALSDNSIDSLKNLTHQANTGFIKLDRPKPYSFAFEKAK